MLIAGNSGLGKSTLAGALARRGHRLLSDDVCVLGQSLDGTPSVRAPFPRLRLAAESMASLGIATGGVERGAMSRRKYNPQVTSFQLDSLPLRSVVVLRRAAQATAAGVRPLPQFEVVRRFDLVHRPRLAHAMGYQGFLFQRIAAPAGSTPIFELSRPHDLDLLDQLAGTVVDFAECAAA